MTPSFEDDLVCVARAAAAVANYCDHAEHNEFVDAAWVLDAGETLRSLARSIAAREGVDLREAYARRLHAIEARNVQSVSSNFDGASAARSAVSWLELQAVQMQHDNAYHPDVVGLHKAEQLRHYALHVAKLCGAVADATSDPRKADEFLANRLPDLLLFGLKLATVMGHRLAESPALQSPDSALTAAA